MRQINEFNFVQSGPRPRTFCKIDKTREQSWTLNYFCNDLLIMTILWLGSYAIISPFIDRPLFIFTKTREPTTYFRLSKAKLAIASTKGSLLVAGELATEGIFPLILFLGGVRFLLRKTKNVKSVISKQTTSIWREKFPNVFGEIFFLVKQKCQKKLTGFLRTPWNSILVCLMKRANLCGLSCSDCEIHCSFYAQEILNCLCLVHVCYTPKMAEYYCKLESQ